ncbi:MAG: nuclear transport factor 2 family protein [Bacteroidota bacterium]
MILRLVTVLLSGTTLACSFDTEKAGSEAIRAVMDQQVGCWNQGDIACFMESYWQSDSLMFISSNGIIYGFDNTYQRYQTRYPDRAAMGQLTFNIINLDYLAPDAYHMVGQWTLDRNSGEIGGHFTLLFRKINGQWVIVRDHTSSSSL